MYLVQQNLEEVYSDEIIVYLNIVTYYISHLYIIICVHFSVLTPRSQSFIFIINTFNLYSIILILSLVAFHISIITSIIRMWKIQYIIYIPILKIPFFNFIHPLIISKVKKGYKYIYIYIVIIL